MSRVVVVTGGNRGIGLAIVRRLLRCADVYVVCPSPHSPVALHTVLVPALPSSHEHRNAQVLGSRSLENGLNAKKTLVAEDTTCEGRLEVAQIDVSSSDSIRSAATALATQHNKIWGIINNAGVGLDLPWCARPLAASVASETLR